MLQSNVFLNPREGKPISFTGLQSLFLSFSFSMQMKFQAMPSGCSSKLKSESFGKEEQIEFREETPSCVGTRGQAKRPTFFTEIHN